MSRRSASAQAFPKMRAAAGVHPRQLLRQRRDSNQARHREMTEILRSVRRELRPFRAAGRPVPLPNRGRRYPCAAVARNAEQASRARHHLRVFSEKRMDRASLAGARMPAHLRYEALPSGKAYAGFYPRPTPGGVQSAAAFRDAFPRKHAPHRQAQGLDTHEQSCPAFYPP